MRCIVILLDAPGPTSYTILAVAGVAAVLGLYAFVTDAPAGDVTGASGGMALPDAGAYPGSGTGATGTPAYVRIESYNDTQNARVNELMHEFKADIRDLLDYEGTDEYHARSAEILSEYDEYFRIMIEHVRVLSGTQTLNELEILAMIDYIFYETIKDEKLKLDRPGWTEPVSQYVWPRSLG